MPNKRSIKILESLRTVGGQEVYDRATAHCGSPEGQEDSAYVPLLMDWMKENIEAERIQSVMQPCSCLSKPVIKTARDLYASSQDLPAFLCRLNEKHIGGGELHMEGDLIIGVYRSCYCGLAKRAKGLPQEYCACSEGWFKQLFGAVLGREVAVRHRGTILGGAMECTFEINVQITPADSSDPA